MNDMKKNLKDEIKAMNKQEIRKIFSDSSSSKEDRKIAEDELLRRNSHLRGDDNSSPPTIDSKKCMKESLRQDARSRRNSRKSMEVHLV